MGLHVRSLNFYLNILERLVTNVMSVTDFQFADRQTEVHISPVCPIKLKFYLPQPSPSFPKVSHDYLWVPKVSQGYLRFLKVPHSSPRMGLLFQNLACSSRSLLKA